MPELSGSSTPPALNDSVSCLRGVGPALCGRLEKLGIATLRDLLIHLPHRYQDRTRTQRLRGLRVGEEVQVDGEIMESREVLGRRRSLLVQIGDGSGFLVLRFFHFNRRQQQLLRCGLSIRCFGEVRLGPNGLEMVHPDYRVFEGTPPVAEQTLTPVYPTTEGVTQSRMRALTRQSLAALTVDAWPPLPAGTADGRLASAVDALRLLHRPPADIGAQALNKARDRLALEELTVHMMTARRDRQLRRAAATTPLPRSRQLGRVLLERLGFELTNAQRRVTREVLLDMEQPAPMLRLVQGDVGSGKTVIAAFAAIRAAEHNRQTAIMAPTEILAEQHYLTFSDWLEPLGISVCLVTGKLSARERRDRMARIDSGEALVAIGTHALFQDRQTFARLGLVIIDEQHRFGVHQRMALRDKGAQPHQLVMTATPIPRTLTMALYADMDLSVIDELPKHRQPIRTVLVNESRRDDVVQQVAAQCRSGRQAYWVCTLVEESEALEASDAESTARTFQELLGDLRIGLIHGRMPADGKAAVMAAFKRREIDLLVATTVVEVGVDVPNASLMVIDNAERLGLSQLHQLRGRIGRGSRQSHCILLYKPPVGTVGRARLRLMRETQDGFVIAEEDLKLRGPGDLLGTRQTGERLFRIADLTEHAHLLPGAQQLAQSLCNEDALYHQLLGIWSPGSTDYYHV